MAASMCFPIRSLSDLRDAEEIITAAPMEVRVEAFALREAGEYYKTLRLHQRGTRNRWQVAPSWTCDVLRDALHLRNLVDELGFRVSQMHEDLNAGGPLINEQRFPSLLEAAGRATIDALRILRSDVPSLAAVAAKAIPAGLEALDICREVDVLADNFAFNRERYVFLTYGRKNFLADQRS